MHEKKVLVLNGVNLGRLGTREPAIYGTQTLADIQYLLKSSEPDWQIDFRQSDDEGQFVRWLHEAADKHLPVIVNAGAWTHYSYAIRDAVSLVTKSGIFVVEVHLSNPQEREEFRHTSVISGVVQGTIAGLGAHSYVLALEAVRRLTQ